LAAKCSTDSSLVSLAYTQTEGGDTADCGDCLQNIEVNKNGRELKERKSRMLLKLKKRSQSSQGQGQW
jgi:hypothetical protein